jgi:hypothetical protein
MSTPPVTSRLAEIQKDLSNYLLEEIADETAFGAWLDKLLSDVYGQILSLNLYIDLHMGCLNASAVANILNRMTYSGSEPRWAFYEYIENNQGEALFNHLGGALTLANDQFVRILLLADMVDYYLRKPLSLPSLSYEAQQEVLDRFFFLPPDRRETLAVVNEVQRGRMLNVWVTSKNALDTALTRITSDNTANKLRDRLGFSGVDNGKLVYIVYPEDFDRASTYVPTTLDTHSGSLFYVSAGENAWGLTCCLSPGTDGMKERVHEPFTGLTADFKLELLGEITESSSPDLDHLLGEAVRRAC